jgi:hypothetical protein
MIFLNFQLEKEEKEKVGGVGFHVKNYGFEE